MPATVTIPAGQTTATFPINAVDNAIADGPQTVTITASAVGLPSATATAVVTDNDTPGITVTPTTGLTTDTKGGSANFTVHLNSQPAINVVVNLTSSKPQVGTVKPTTLTFTPQNYNIPKTATVTGVVNANTRSNQTYTISVVGSQQSSDAAYRGLAGPSVTVTNLTVPGTGGFILTPTSATPLTTSQAGADATFTIRLTAPPAAGEVVRFVITSSDQTQGVAVPEALHFTSQDWNQPQTVTIRGRNDHAAGADTSYKISVSCSSGDPAYANLPAQSLTIINKHTDKVGFTLSATSGLTTTAGAGRIALRSASIQNRARMSSFRYGATTSAKVPSRLRSSLLSPAIGRCRKS